MNGKQIIILIGALIVSALILWNDLPIEFPGIMGKVVLFVKLSVILAVTIFACIFAGGKKKAS